MTDIPDFSQAAFDEVRALHVLIEDWFNARLPADALDALLACFTDDFSMVGIGGVRLDKPALARFFAAAHGGRAGLRIAVDDLAFLALPGNACAVRYREDQTGAQGSTRREALALLRADAGGVLRWQALHETSVGS
ncbi:DUF4440 domain-containing protein [Stenotrophomonas sp. GZD-301]|uniref:DUF4440 domain-containing protein n=1 Tax=Stenotrophomonas sp. GZD-301 TaxID=3404814 RepID=UPI003BB76EBC